MYHDTLCLCKLCRKLQEFKIFFTDTSEKNQRPCYIDAHIFPWTTHLCKLAHSEKIAQLLQRQTQEFSFPAGCCFSYLSAKVMQAGH